MSRANGAVLTKDGKIFYCEYNGTVDVMIPNLYTTRDEMQSNWRTKRFDLCSHPDSHKKESVKVATSYGYGFSWDGFMCVECNCLVSPLEPDYKTESNELPDWYPDDLIPFNHKDVNKRYK